MSTVSVDEVAGFFAMFAVPTRLRILYGLGSDERAVSDIVSLAGTHQANVSGHLRLMERAGVLSRRRDGNQVYYRLADKRVMELCAQANRLVAACGASAR